MPQPRLTDLEFLPTNSHALIRALKADFDEARVAAPLPGVPLDVHYAQIQRHAGAVELIDELYSMMLEDLEAEDDRHG